MIPSKSLSLLAAEYGALGSVVEACHFGKTEVVLHEKDTAPLARTLNVIAPISFRTVTAGEKRVIHCAAYSELYDTARSFFEAWSEAPFSCDALSQLHTLLLPTLASWGYDGSKFPHRYGVACLLSQNGVTPLSARAGVRMLDALDVGRTSLVTMRLPDGVARGAAGYITEQGEVASMAAVNGALDAHRFAEIGVECAPRYRKQGIAAEVTACLCEHLLSSGKTPLYCHYYDNAASAALASRVGFLPAGKFYSYQAWKRTDR